MANLSAQEEIVPGQENFQGNLKWMQLTKDTFWSLVWNTPWKNKEYTIKDGSVGSRTTGKLKWLMV